MSDSRQQVPGFENYHVLINQPLPPTTDLKYPTGRMLGLTITQLICGVLSIGFGIASVCLPDYFEYGPGIWCGAMYCISGSLGIPAARHKKKGFIITYMVMSIISASFCLIPLVTYILYLGTGVGNDEEWNYIYVTYPSGGGGYYRLNYTVVPNGAKYSVLSILVFISLVEVIIAIISSVCCCRAVCCCQNNTGAHQTVYGYPNAGHSMPVSGLPPVSTQTANTSRPGVQANMPVYNAGPPVNNIPTSYVNVPIFQQFTQPPSYGTLGVQK